MITYSFYDGVLLEAWDRFIPRILSFGDNSLAVMLCDGMCYQRGVGQVGTTVDIRKDSLKDNLTHMSNARTKMGRQVYFSNTVLL